MNGLKGLRNFNLGSQIVSYQACLINVQSGKLAHSRWHNLLMKALQILSMEGFLKIVRIITVMIPEGHKTVWTLLWRYHGNTGNVLVMVLDVLSIANDTRRYQVCKVLCGIDKYCLVLLSILKVLSGTLFSLPVPREGFEPSIPRIWV